MNRKWSLALCVLLLVCSGCAKLDSATAAKEIESSLSKSESSIVVHIGRLSTHCILYVENGQEYERKIEREKDTSANIAMKAGYVTIAPDKAGFWVVALTEKGKAVRDQHWSETKHHTDHNGCEYDTAGFLVARPQLVGVTGITGDESAPQVDYQYKWIPTELGIALQENGAIYKQIDGYTRIGLHALGSDYYGLEAPIPLPQESQIQTQAAQFKRSTGAWKLLTVKVN